MGPFLRLPDFMEEILRTWEIPRVFDFPIAWALALVMALLPVSRIWAATPSSGMWEVQVKSVVMDPRNGQPILVLEDKKNGRILPIWVGPSEAQAIMMQLEGIRPPRPMTHDLLRDMIEKFQARVVRVIVTELRSGTFYAHIEMESGDRKVSLDSRPSDAVALALRTRSPIFVQGEVWRGGVLKLTHRVRLGIVLQAMNPSLARFFGGSDKGLLVSQVTKGSAGEKSGLRRGDVILNIEGKSVSTVEEFEKIYPEYSDGFSMVVIRGKSRSKVQIRIVPEGGESSRSRK